MVERYEGYSDHLFSARGGWMGGWVNGWMGGWVEEMDDDDGGWIFVFVVLG